MFEFNPVKPVGHRTCCDLPHKTGTVQHSWLDTDVADYVTEEQALRAGNLSPKLTRQQHLDALAVFTSLKGRAARGQLPIGDDKVSPAKIMRRVAYVIELRPLLSKKGARPPRLFRLYYAEPASVQDALLPLVLSTKPDGGDPNGEQNASIDDAQARSRVWELYKQAS